MIIATIYICDSGSTRHHHDMPTQYRHRYRHTSAHIITVAVTSDHSCHTSGIEDEIIVAETPPAIHDVLLPAILNVLFYGSDIYLSRFVCDIHVVRLTVENCGHCYYRLSLIDLLTDKLHMH